VVGGRVEVRVLSLCHSCTAVKELELELEILMVVGVKNLSRTVCR
jgi:hypothetical protein